MAALFTSPSMPPYASTVAADHRGGRLVRRHVGAHEQPADVGGHLLPRLLVEVGDDDACALGGERPGVGLADALGRAGDDDDLALEPVHAGNAIVLTSRYSSNPTTPISRPSPDCL